jgi:hypothetical protein
LGKKGKMAKAAPARSFVGRVCTWENCSEQAHVIARWAAWDVTSPGADVPYCDAHGYAAEGAGAKIVDRIEAAEAEAEPATAVDLLPQEAQ